MSLVGKVVRFHHRGPTDLGKTTSLTLLFSGIRYCTLAMLTPSCYKENASEKALGLAMLLKIMFAQFWLKRGVYLYTQIYVLSA